MTPAAADSSAVPAAPSAAAPSAGAETTFEAIAENGAIAVPPELHAALGPTFRVRVTVPAAAPAAKAPAAGAPYGPDPALVAAHPDWEWATPERMAELMPKLPPPGEPIDLGPFEGTPMGELMRNPLPVPADGFLTREEANEDPHRNRKAIAMLKRSAARREPDGE